MNQMLATRRYGATQQTRSLRDQEADVFRRVNYGLKAAMNGVRIIFLSARHAMQKAFDVAG